MNVFFSDISEMPPDLAVKAPPQESDRQVANPVRQAALVFALFLIFVRVSMLHTVLTGYFGINIYPLYIFAIPALLGMAITGGGKRVFHYGVAKYWMLFFVWMVFCTPFSVWRGGALQSLWDFGRSELPMLLIVAGLAVDWRDCKKILYTIAFATALSLVLFRSFSVLDNNGRMSLERAGIGSIIGNANDYAGYLLFLLPFLLWVAIKSKWFVIRIAGLGVIGYGLYMILISGSRGAAVAVAADFVFLFFAVSSKRKIMLFALLPIMLIAVVSFIPKETIQRLTTFGSNDADSEAVASQEARTELAMDAIKCAVIHPLLGVGPGQFTTYEGPTTKNWHNAHNSYLEAASETGFPGFILYILALYTSARLLRRVKLSAKTTEGGADIEKAALCMQLAFVGYCTAILFLNFTYFFILPMFSGLCIAMASAMKLTEHRVAEVQESNLVPE